MREELDLKLVEKYPRIFKNRYAPMTETAMCWGFEHGDGWYNIINALCSNIQSHIDWRRKQRAQDLRRYRAARKGKQALLNHIVGDGVMRDWHLERAEEIMESFSNGTFKITEKVHQVVAMQVKEKFGTLRFYYSGGDSEVSGMVRMAETMSALTCETCGSPGHTRNGGWIRTLCDAHEAEHQQKMLEREE